MEITPDKKKVVGLVEKAHTGEFCLPNFQRDFVWPRDQVADLIRSMLRGYYIGSLLLLRCDPQNPPFAPEFLRGAKAAFLKPRPEFLILDGQQRLTALLYALTAPDLRLKYSSQRRWFFVDLDLLIGDPDNDEIVFDRTERELDGLDKSEVQFDRHVLPCTALLTRERYDAWRDAFEDWIRESKPEAHAEFRKQWRDAWTKAVTGFQSFEAPVIELPRVHDGNSESIGRVCAIFEKLNSRGVELSIYDLLTARLYRSGIRLHDLWKESCQRHPRLAKWSGGKADTNKFGVLILRTLALIRDLEPKPRILIDLVPTDFEDDWRRAAAAMERAIEQAELVGPDGFGVFDQKWVPGYGQLPVLAALRAKIDELKLGEGPRADLRRWYWSSVFLERYSSAVESTSRKDYSEMLAYWTDGKGAPAVFTKAQETIGGTGLAIADSFSSGSAVYSGAFCLLAMEGARDWARGESIRLQELQDHHIFPKAYLRRNGIEKSPMVNSILNRTLISGDTNQKIRDKSPAEYLEDPEVFPSGPTNALVGPHFIDAEAVSAMRGAGPTTVKETVAERYKEFRRAREALLLQRIRVACGVASVKE